MEDSTRIKILSKNLSVSINHDSFEKLMSAGSAYFHLANPLPDSGNNSKIN
jgi:hypothetical protein